MLPDLQIGFSRGRSGGLVFPSLSEFSTVYCDPHIGFGIVNKTEIDVFLELTCFFDETKLCRATQDGRVMVERSARMWSTGEGNGKPLQYSCLENPMNSMKRQKDRTLKDELPRSVCALYATGDQWRNNSRKNEGMEPKQKQYPVVDGTGDRSKV